MKGNCGECERRWYCDINPDECDAWPDPVPQTNADHIRSMTDEELLGCLLELQDTAIKRFANFELPNYQWMADWLKQPYGGDT